MSDSDFTIPISQSESHSEHNIEYGYKTLEAGELLNQRFLIVRELGSGGFATTYLASDKYSSKPKKYAVKQLQPRFNSPSVWASAKERLTTEAMVLQWLGKHPQIPKFIGHFEENQQFYLVLEFIEGEELEQEVARQVLNETQAIQFLCDVLEILKSVHQQGIIHRDIKPSNLIRRVSDRKMTLIDFGAVKEIGTLVNASKQIKTQIIGTPGYMPPEQNNGKPVYSSDIYALGKTVIFGMTNKSPTEWETNDGTTIAWNKKIAVSEAFLKIVNRMTAESTANRYGGAVQVLRDLEPLKIIGKTIGNKYQIIKYLGGRTEAQSYVGKSLKQAGTRYYIEILQPRTTVESISKTAKKIMAGFNSLPAVGNRVIPVVVEYFIDSSTIYIVQEYVEGKNLAQIIEDRFILNESEVIDLLLNTSTALNIFHKQQIVHGNLQPSSLIKGNGNSGEREITLVDFGLVNEAINLLPDNKTGYVPPEQIAGKAVFVSDIYALGMTAIHVLTGTSPQNLEKNPRTGEILWHRKARISPGLARILDKMICLNKNQRYQSLNKLIKDLKKIKYKSRFRGTYKYLLIIPAIALFAFVGLTQWAQRVAILEFYKGDLKLEASKYSEAIEYYENGLKKLPNTRGQVKNFEQVWLKKAKAQRQLNNYQGALQTCSAALRHYQSPQLWNCKALTFYSLEKYTEAIAAYDRALEIDPENIWLWNNRGEAYVKLEEFDRAISDFKTAIELDPSRSFIPWNNLGKLYYEQQNYQQAILSYNEALTIKSDYLPALIGRGNAQKVSGLYYQASDSYDRALAVNPNYHEAWYGKGSVAEYLRQDLAAIEYYQKAVDLKPDWEAAIRSLERVENRLSI